MTVLSGSISPQVGGAIRVPIDSWRATTLVVTEKRAGDAPRTTHGRETLDEIQHGRVEALSEILQETLCL